LRIKTFAIFLLIVILFILALAWQMGAFKRVNLVVGECPEVLVAGVWLHAPYEEILDYADEHLLPIEKASTQITGVCALYYDNPSLILVDSLFAFAGVILSDSSAAPPNLELRLVTPHSAVTTSFSGSAVIGQYKIYPAVERWFASVEETWDAPTLEIYHRTKEGHRVDYYFPIVKNRLE